MVVLKRVKKEYIIALEDKNECYLDFFREKAKLCWVYKDIMYSHMDKFKAMYEIKQEVYGDGAEELTLQESLSIFLENNPIE